MKEQPPGEPLPNGSDAERPAEPDPSGGPETPEAPVQENVTPLPPPVDPVRAELEATLVRLRDTEARLREVSKAFRDLEADMDAFRRRSQAAADQRAERRVFEVVEQFFEPVRNLRRSVDASSTDPTAVVEGIKMVAHQFDETMRRLGLVEIPAMGQVFDPSIHEALAVSPVADREQDNRVLFVHAAGYRIGAKVLQPAQVVIGKFGEPTEA
jgi:molecular chaperone GrpE